MAENALSYPALNYLKLDIADTATVENVLASLPNRPPCHLEIPSVQTYPSPAVVHTVPEHVGNIIAQNGDSISEIGLLDAWASDAKLADELNASWLGRFVITELVLGAKSSLFWEDDLDTLEMRNTLEHNLYGYCSSKGHGRWGTELKRVCIDQVDPQDFDPTGLAAFPLKNLKILILCPWEISSTIFAKPEDETVFESYPQGRLALKIAASPPPSLRLLVITSYRYWLIRTEGESGATLCSLFQAQQDPEQKEVLQAALSVGDWKFLENNTAMTRRRGYKPSKTLEFHQPDAQYLRGWNYMVMQRVVEDNRLE